MSLLNVGFCIFFNIVVLLLLLVFAFATLLRSLSRLVLLVPCCFHTMLLSHFVTSCCRALFLLRRALLLVLSCFTTRVFLLFMLLLMLTPYNPFIVALPSHLATCLFQVPFGPPQLLFRYLATHCRTLLFCLLVNIPPHSLVQVEELGATPISFIQ